MNNETSNPMPEATDASPEIEQVKKARKPRAPKPVAEVPKPGATRKQGVKKTAAAEAKLARKRAEARAAAFEAAEALEAPEESLDGATNAVAVDEGAEGAEVQNSSKSQNIDFSDVISGDFDDEEENGVEALIKRVLAPQVDSPKLHKVLAQAGMGSRLEMEKLILEGRISVNGEPAHVGQRVQFGDIVKVNGEPIRFRIDPPPARVIAYHKPVGEVVTHDDPQNRPTVFRKLPRLQHGKWQSVGRLDLNTEGLLLFTSSGELANNLMHPRFGLEREYAARVLGALDKEEKKRLIDGVQLDDGEASFGAIEDGGGEGANCWYRVTISEGRNREVRRMFEAVGHAVSRLIRIRYGAMMLPRGLKRGAWVELDQADIKALMSAAGMKERAPVERVNPVARGANNRGGRGPAANADRAPQGRREGGGQRRGEWDGNRPAPMGIFGDGREAPRGNKSVPRPGSSAAMGRGQQGAGNNQNQPDPLRTAVSYIGSDSLSRARQTAKRRPSGGGGGRRGGR
ncbi:rRNA pseudouridine synthase [Comamonas sp. Y33R10-2]|uniref:pseudouridine synthase n=1 Tax=Comamonas sp. Y33R10-2 TaxID=2853257 RepID=UPI001C5CC2F6|nr:pseudouridine synthase [Comamonas sp. Y33R10-2]QXZ08341.1 rRNA pseudouridine synthase [Comamonas sp. Y33R10-2]